MARRFHRGPLVALALLLLVLLSACSVDATVTVKVRDDGSGYVQADVTADAEAVQSAEVGGGKLEDRVRLSDLPAAGWTVSPWVHNQDTEELVLESAEEHLAVKRVLADMLAMEASDDRFDAKLSVLKEQIRHHARDEEEGKLFKQVRRMFDKDELAALGNELMAMFEELMEQEPRMEVPSQTREAAPLEMQL